MISPICVGRSPIEERPDARRKNNPAHALSVYVFILAFLPAVVFAYYCVAGSAAARQGVLIAASLVFYAWWDVRFVPLVIGQIAATWALCLLADALQRRWLLAVGIVLNLASLCTFKYLDFLVGILTAALKPDGILDVVIRQKVPPDWLVSVFDARSMRVARSRHYAAAASAFAARSATVSANCASAACPASVSS